MTDPELQNLERLAKDHDFRYNIPGPRLLELVAAIREAREQLAARDAELAQLTADLSEARMDLRACAEALAAIKSYKPREVVMDEYAYRRLVKVYRAAADAALAALGEK